MSAFIRRTRPMTSLTAIAVSLVAASLAVSQSEYQTQTTPPGPFHDPVPPYPVEAGFSQHHSSTAFEGAARGRAALIQAHGNYELSHAQARILYQQARWIDRVNDLEQTRALHVQQQMWQENRDAVRKAREERAAIGKAKLEERSRTLYRDTYRLNSDQLDVATGEINWPAVLQAEVFSGQRAQVEQLIRRHFAYDGPQIATAQEIARKVEKLQRTLRTYRSAFGRDEYMAAQVLLRGLRYEAEAACEQG